MQCTLVLSSCRLKTKVPFLLFTKETPKPVHFPNSLHNLLQLIAGLPANQTQPHNSTHKPATWAAAPHGDSSSSPSTTPEPRVPDSLSRNEGTGTAEAFQVHCQFGKRQTRCLGPPFILSDAVTLASWLQFNIQFHPLWKNSLLPSSALKRLRSCSHLLSLAGWLNITARSNSQSGSCLSIIYLDQNSATRPFSVLVYSHLSPTTAFRQYVAT